jgi:hypothetical protein
VQSLEVASICSCCGEQLAGGTTPPTSRALVRILDAPRSVLSKFHQGMVALMTGGLRVDRKEGAGAAEVNSGGRAFSNAHEGDGRFREAHRGDRGCSNGGNLVPDFLPAETAGACF